MGESCQLGQWEQVLFVDDQEAICVGTAQCLDRLGYRVCWSASGRHALELFRMDPDRFDLVMTDLSMPELNGMELAQEILRLRPSIPVILFSGYADTMSDERVRELGIQGFLKKPFSTSELSGAIRRALAGAESMA
jgi:DNA-binding NtrC family response regulator